MLVDKHLAQQLGLPELAEAIEKYEVSLLLEDALPVNLQDLKIRK